MIIEVTMYEAFCIHGWAANAKIWPQWLRNNNCYLYQSNSYPDYEQLAETFCSIYRQHQQPLHLIGWSLGGMLALQLSSAFPEKIQKLTLISSTARFTLLHNYPHGLSCSIVKNLSRKIKTNPLQTLLDFYSLMFSDNEQPFYQTFITTIAPELSTIPHDSLQNGLTYLLKQDLRLILSSIQMPCHIIHGTKDTICLTSAAEYMHQHISNSKLSLLKNTGHIPFYTQSEACRQLIFTDFN